MLLYIRANLYYGGVELGIFNLTLSKLLARIIVLFTAITVHECAHGYVAYKLGDPTAKYSGRLSLNPIKHFDPMGALCMLLCGFGWAKPVPINPMYFRDRKRDSAICALAGPVSNIILTFLSTIFAALFAAFVAIQHPNVITDFVKNVFLQLAVINISFAIFNLLPIPPLDGSKVLGAFLSNQSYNKLLRYEMIGMPILLILSISGVLGKILGIFINPLFELWLKAYYGLLSIFM